MNVILRGDTTSAEDDRSLVIELDQDNGAVKDPALPKWLFGSDTLLRVG